MAVTIKDVARVAGVSHTTVSRALRGHPAISAETSSTIKRIADDMGYIPNTVARGLKTNRSYVLGVIVRRIDDPFYSLVIKGIEDELQAAGYSLFLAASGRDAKREEEIVKVMAQQRVDGVIIGSTFVSRQHREQLERFGVSTVLLNNQAQQEAGNAVYHDDAYGGRQLAEHLISLGHTQIGYVGNGNAGQTNAARLDGVRAALAAINHPIPDKNVSHANNGRPDGGGTATAQLLKNDDPPTAIVCFNDMMAIGAIHALSQTGRRVPNDCSVVGFDNIAISAYSTPPLTTFDQPKHQLGLEAARMLLRIINEGTEGTEGKQETVKLRGKLVIRQSAIDYRE